MSSWFESAFGFREASFPETQSRFSIEDDGNVMMSSANGSRFYVGPFETPTVSELRMRSGTTGVTTQSDANPSSLHFENIVGDVQSLTRDKKNAGSVFQVASQFNCLEMVNPGVRPESGITSYASDLTQGPRAAITCPAATVYRNYFSPSMVGQAGGYFGQIDCLSDVGVVVGNESDASGVGTYWSMKVSLTVYTSGTCIYVHICDCLYLCPAAIS